MSSSSEQAALEVLYIAVRNLGQFRCPNAGDPQSGLETSAAGVHDLLRRRIPTYDDRHYHLHRRSDAPLIPRLMIVTSW